MSPPEKHLFDVVDLSDPEATEHPPGTSTRSLIEGFRERAKDIAPFGLIDLDDLLDKFERGGCILVFDEIDGGCYPLNKLEDRDLKAQCVEQIKDEIIYKIHSSDPREAMDILDNLFEIHFELKMGDPCIRLVTAQEAVDEAPFANN